jgi:hypothetical protein
VNRPEHHLSRLLILKHLERLRRLIKPVKPVANKALFALDLLPVLLLSSLRGRRLGRPPADITEEDVLVPTEAFEGVGEDGSDGATAKGELEVLVVSGGAGEEGWRGVNACEQDGMGGRGDGWDEEKEKEKVQLMNEGSRVD